MSRHAHQTEYSQLEKSLFSDIEALDPRVWWSPGASVEREKQRISDLYTRIAAENLSRKVFIPDDALYPAKSAARILDISDRTLARWIADGRIKVAPLPAPTLRISGRELKRLIHG